MATIKDLKFDDKNFNKHTEFGMSLLEKSLRENGAGRSILIDKDNNIIAGNGIVESAGQIGLDKVKVVETTGDEIIAVKRTDISLNSKKGRKMALADNSTAKADLEWDEENLKSEFDEEELKDWGVDLDWQEETEVTEDEAPDVNESEPADSELGKVYHLGNHRLMCGDSTDAGSVAILMDGQKADMVFTDPPYGMNLDTDYSKMPSTKKEGNKTYSKVIGDNEDFTPELITTTLTAFNYCNELFMFGADYFAELIPNRNDGCWFVWDKRVEEQFDKMFGSSFELCWSKSKHKRDIIRCNNTLFSGEQDARNKVHPTQKPLKVVSWFLEKFSNIDNIVVDTFGGSGSTLIACEQLGRRCFMMELDPKYCDVIRKRYWKLTTGSEEGWQDGTKAISVN